MKTIITVILSIHYCQSTYTPPDKESYCEDIKCFRKNHMICDDFSPEHSGFLGKEPTPIHLTSFQKEVILQTHNELRNVIACGELKLNNLAGETFPRADMMHALYWDEELEWAASLNAATCSSKHDCPKTPTFHRAGQNLAMAKSNVNINVTDFLRSSVIDWFVEYLNTPLSVIDGYSTELVKDFSTLSEEEFKKIRPLVKGTYVLKSNGHFTTLIKDSSSKVGCALYSCGPASDILTHSIYFVCNYEMTNLIGESTYNYDTNKPRCERSDTFCCLCSDREEAEVENSAIGVSCFVSDLEVPVFESQSELDTTTSPTFELETTTSVGLETTTAPMFGKGDHTEALTSSIFGSETMTPTIEEDHDSTVNNNI